MATFKSSHLLLLRKLLWRRYHLVSRSIEALARHWKRLAWPPRVWHLGLKPIRNGARHLHLILALKVHSMHWRCHCDRRSLELTSTGSSCHPRNLSEAVPRLSPQLLLRSL